MDLPSTFHYKGWTIKYRLTTPSSSSTNQDATKTIVFVHGTPWSSVVFEPLADALSATGSYRILLYDLPGYGQSQTFSGTDATSPNTRTDGTTATGTSTSSPPSLSNTPTFPGQTSISFQSSTLHALLSHLSLTQQPYPHMIAHDIAGAIVLRAHLLHNLEFADMLLLDTNAVLPWGDGFYQLARAQPDVFLKMPPDVYEAVVGAVVRSACFGRAKGWEDVLVQPWLDHEPEDHPSRGDVTQRQQKGEEGEEQRETHDDASHKPRQMSFVRQIAQADDADVREMLDAEAYGKVRCDVRIIWGEEDRWIPGWKIEELARRLGGRHKGTVAVPAAGHLVMLDQPERVAVEVFRWLER